MAIYRLSSQSIGRSSGKSVVAAAAYRSGEKLQDHSIEKTFDYTKKKASTIARYFYPKTHLSHLKIVKPYGTKLKNLKRELMPHLPKNIS